MNFDYTLYPGRRLKEKNEYIENIEPIISIITPYYNSKKYIKETANSILNQTFPYFEWLIIDDGSTDEESIKTLNEIEKMDSRIKVINKENEGASIARDFGAKNASASSKYLFFLDDDDLIIDTFLECAYWTLETNKDASWTYADVVNFVGEEYLWRKWFDSKREQKENLLVNAAMIRKNDFLEVDGFNIKEKAVYEDWNLWLKLLAKEKYPVRMSFLGFWYRRKPKNESELSRSKDNKNAINYIKETAEQIKKDVQAIQYPKYDYNWEEMLDSVPEIVMPKEKENDKINILMIIPWMAVGGADKFILDIISKIDKEKYSTTIITTVPNDNCWRQKFEEYATIYDLTTFLDRKYWLAFINYIIEKNNINVIFNSNSTFGYSALPYLKVKNPSIPIIDYVHMEEWYERNGGFSRDSSGAKDYIDHTYVCNKNSEKILVDYFKRNPNEVSTVYIGVDEKKYDPTLYNKNEILDKLNINCGDKKIISFICRIAEQKRPHLLLEIIKELKRRRNDFVFIVAGEGPMLKEIKSKAKTLGVYNDIIFLGNIQKTEEIYAISDLTLNCSIKEGLALTAYESLAMGVPVVSSDVGGQKELINDEVGVIVPCIQDEKDVRIFNYSKEEIIPYIDGIEKILNNLENYKQKCRQRILDSFTIDKMVKKMEEIFEKTAKEPNQEKIENAKLQNLKLTKEYITMYNTAYEEEYEWHCKQFNMQNIDMSTIVNKLKGKENPMYEHTLEYKIKHPIVVFLRKIGVYDLFKKILGKNK